jgi:hypothetical protein
MSTFELVLGICYGILIVGKGVKECRDRNSGWACTEEPMLGKTPALSQQHLMVVVSMPSGISEPHGLKSIDVVDFRRTSSGFEAMIYAKFMKKKMFI